MKFLRVGSWWNTVVPQVLGWIYFCMLSKVFYVVEHPGAPAVVLTGKADIARYILFFIALISIASFGYLLNDLCDIHPDTIAGKPNGLARFGLLTGIVIVIIPVLTGSAAWYELNRYPFLYLSAPTVSNVLFGAQILALIIYSVKPVRLKERAEFGVIVDAFYGHLNPVLLTIYVFNLNGLLSNWGHIFMFLLIGLCSVKGVRNILLHQIEDRKKDLTAGLNTAVTKYGPWRVINLINQYLFPAEMFFLFCLTVVICSHIPPVIIPLVAFAIISYLKFSGWKLGYADRRLLEFKFTYFMNDYYEGWLPVFLVAFLSVYQHGFVFLLILHLILFPSFLIKAVKDIKAIRDNFKIEEDY